jgi:hypothetical protein
MFTAELKINSNLIVHISAHLQCGVDSLFGTISDPGGPHHYNVEIYHVFGGRNKHTDAPITNFSVIHTRKHGACKLLEIILKQHGVIKAQQDKLSCPPVVKTKKGKKQ